MRLPHPDKSGPAMTKSEVLDESGNYKNLEKKEIDGQNLECCTWPVLVGAMPGGGGLTARG